MRGTGVFQVFVQLHTVVVQVVARVAELVRPLWSSQMRPGREHETTCAKAEADLLPALERGTAGEGLLTPPSWL